MPPKKGKKAKAEPIDPAQVVRAFQKPYVSLCKERGLDPLRLGPADDNYVLSTEYVFTKLVLHPNMKTPCDLPSFVCVLDALASYKYLRHLCVWKVPLAEDGCARLSRFLLATKTLARVELLDCSIGSFGCTLIAEAIQASPVVTQLSLDHNQVCDAGVEALCAALQHNVALQSLSLRYCGITFDGAEQCSRLIGTSRLKNLDLCGAELQALGAALCLAALKDNTSMTRIGLACTSWSSEGAVTQTLINAMEGNTTCNEYDIDGNPIGDANALKLALTLRKTPHVTSLRTTDQLTPALFNDIVKTAEANYKEWLKTRKKKKGKKASKAN